MIRHLGHYRTVSLAGMRGGLVLLAVSQTAATASGLVAAARPDERMQTAAARCQMLAGARWIGFELESSQVRQANSRDALAPGIAAPGQLPAFCRVVARARPSPRSDIKFEVWLPTSGWDGRLSTAGNGGLGGYIS